MVWTYRESLVELCESCACITTGKIDVRTPGKNICVRLISLTDNDRFSAIRAFTWIFVETYTTWPERKRGKCLNQRREKRMSVASTYNLGKQNPHNSPAVVQYCLGYRSSWVWEGAERIYF